MQPIASENVRNRRYFSFPYFNLYIAKEYLVVVPTMKRWLHNMATISFIIFALVLVGSLIGTMQAQQTDWGSAVLCLVVFLVSWGFSYLLKNKYVKELRTMSWEELSRQPGFAATYEIVKIDYLGGHAIIHLGDNTVRVYDHEGRKLESMLEKAIDLNHNH